MNAGTQSDFDKIAPYYDRLARLVYGKHIVHAQTHHLKSIPASSKIVILGGGTGWIISEVLKATHNCQIWYIEASRKMLQMATENCDNDQVRFIRGTENDLPVGITFDVIITGFYLDLFTDHSIAKVIQHISRSLHPQGRWLVTDFVINTYWHRVLCWCMYRFFRWYCTIDATRLPPWEDTMRQIGFRAEKERNFYLGFIKSVLYKQDHSF